MMARVVQGAHQNDLVHLAAPRDKNNDDLQVPSCFFLSL
jgi:hypothetical protein